MAKIPYLPKIKSPLSGLFPPAPTPMKAPRQTGLGSARFNLKQDRIGTMRPTKRGSR